MSTAVVSHVQNTCVGPGGLSQDRAAWVVRHPAMICPLPPQNLWHRESCRMTRTHTDGSGMCFCRRSLVPTNPAVPLDRGS